MVILGNTRDPSHMTACLQTAAGESRASMPQDLPRLLSQPPLASRHTKSHVAFLSLILPGFFATELSTHIWDAPDACCPGISQLSKAPAMESHPRSLLERRLPVPSDPPAQSCCWDRTIALRSPTWYSQSHTSHQSLPDRRVPAQLIIFHTQVTSHLWSSLLLQAVFSSIIQKAFELEKPELYTLLRTRAVA